MVLPDGPTDAHQKEKEKKTSQDAHPWMQFALMATKSLKQKLNLGCDRGALHCLNQHKQHYCYE